MQAKLDKLLSARQSPDRGEIADAFQFASRAHEGQSRLSGEPFISHPLEVALICDSLGADKPTIIAALLHDTAEDTSVTIEEIADRFGDEVGGLVDGLTKIDRLSFSSSDEAQAENYRKMLVAMASDMRVIIIKLADRLHNMRTLSALPAHKQSRKARETLDVYAPLSHRLGIHSIKWELEDLAFATLHPRKYQDLKALVSQQRKERELYLSQAAEELEKELEGLGVEADISGRAKHFYSIHSKMTRKGKEFNEIYDLTAMRVLVESVKDCYAALGAAHALWAPLPGRFKDMIAMPKTNLYQSLHTTVIGPGGRPLEIQIRTHEMHQTAEYGVAAHWTYKHGSKVSKQEQEEWLRSVLDFRGESGEVISSLREGLFEKEVFVFTPEGEVKALSSGATPLDFAYAIHTELGHSCVGAKVNGRIVPLGYELKSGDRVEVLTGRRGPSRDWISLVKTSRARNKIKQWFKAESRDDAERKGREMLHSALKDSGLPPRKITGSPILAEAIKELGFKKSEDFYVALGSGKLEPRQATDKILLSLRQGQAASPEEELDERLSKPRSSRAISDQFGIQVQGVDSVMIRLAKCCHPVPGDPITGYVSLGRGITIHRDDCPNVASLRRDPQRFVPVRWEGEHQASFQAEIHVDAWDRHRLLEDLTGAIAEQGAHIVEVKCLDQRPMVSDRFIVEVADTRSLKATINRLRQVEGVFDVYRVTPSA